MVSHSLHSGCKVVWYYYYHGPNPKHFPGLIASEAWLPDPDTRSHDRYLEHSAQQQRLSQLGA